jgi:hypothetical protein
MASYDVASNSCLALIRGLCPGTISGEIISKGGQGGQGKVADGDLIPANRSSAAVRGDGEAPLIEAKRPVPKLVREQPRPAQRAQPAPRTSDTTTNATSRAGAADAASRGVPRPPP